jgi:hypothetical protein
MRVSAYEGMRVSASKTCPVTSKNAVHRETGQSHQTPKALLEGSFELSHEYLIAIWGGLILWIS